MNEVPRPNLEFKFIVLKGTVVQIFDSKTLETKHLYECLQCKHQFIVLNDKQLNNIIPKPVKCTGFSEKGKGCISRKFNRIFSDQLENQYIDYQEIKVQESFKHLSIGEIPQSITILVENDLVNTCSPGDKVSVSGVVFQRWKTSNLDCRCDIETMLHANYIDQCQKVYKTTNSSNKKPDRMTR